MPVEDYDSYIGRTPEERARAAKTLDHVVELQQRSDGKELLTPFFPAVDSSTIRNQFQDVTHGK